MVETKYSKFLKGWVGFRHGKAVRTNDKRVKIFATEAEARKAAEKSRMQFGAK